MATLKMALMNRYDRCPVGARSEEANARANQNGGFMVIDRGNLDIS